MSPNDILREQFEKETGYKLPDVRDYNSFELNVKLADYYERFSGWMKSKCEELQKENEVLIKGFNIVSAERNELRDTLHAVRNKMHESNLHATELQRRIDEVNNIEYHIQGMGCGLEDIGVTDRYDAMAHGWDEAMESVGRTLNVELEADDE